MSKNHAKELFGKFNENTDDYDKYIDTVKYCESIEDEIRSEENVKFHAKLRRLEGLLSCLIGEKEKMICYHLFIRYRQR